MFICLPLFRPASTAFPARVPGAARRAHQSASALLKLGTLLGLLLAGRLAHAHAGNGALARLAHRPTAARRVLAAPVAYARTSQILLNSYADTRLAVPLAATDADPGSSITSYSVTALPPAAAGVLRLNGTAVTTATVIAAANAGNLTFDPAAGYFGTAVFQYRARDNSGTTSAAVTYGLPVSKAACGAGVGQANLLDYYARADGEDWKVPRTVSVGDVVVTTSGYAASAGTTNSLAIAEQAGLPGKGLTWLEDYGSSAATTATLTFAFSRPVSNFTLTAGDIDSGTGFTDQLIIQGYDANNTLVAIPSANVAVGASNSYSNNTFTATAASDGLASSNIVATFPAAITRLVLTYRNTSTQADPALQGIVFASFAWCAQADVQTTLTGPGRAQGSSTVSYTATTRNGGGDLVNTIVPTVQLPTGLPAVTGGSYASATGVLTLPTISNLAAGASVAQTLTYTMPNTGAVTGTASFSSTADDPVVGNNTATITTTQNRAPVASNVTNSPAILKGTATATNTAPFNASDPDATAGNTTIVSYTISSLPTATQGVLYVNGVAATAGQVIGVPPTATAASPGYQLSFIPGSTFTGTANVLYRATDDVGTNSNFANYDIPVTGGADVVATVSGSTAGVEGQTASYSVTTTNNGPEVATSLVPTLTLANLPPFSSVTVASGSYNPSTGVVTFSPVALLASGATVVNTVTVVLQPTPTSFSVVAASTSATADPVLANNNGTAAAAITTAIVSRIGAAGVASACADPGRNGSLTITDSPNTYFAAANQTLAAGATALTLGAAVGTAPIAIGDLLLVIQMQGADIDASNSDSYGNGVAGGLATSNLNNANFTAGQYEYVVAASAVPLGGGPLTVATGLKNGYQNADATGSTGQRRFQVVRVPQYQDLTVSGLVAPSAWNGRTGGILALDVVGQLTFAAGAQLDASGKGFRGGAGQQLAGTTGLTGTDYRAAAYAGPAGAHAMKGEGLVGTPRYVNTGAALLDTGLDGYPSGSAGRGAPGNAGGGGTDANPTANTNNSGGGGGGNGSRGGRGGNAWSSGAAVGGESGAPFSVPSSSRLVLGGGGGAGVNNSGSGSTPASGYASSGAAGGGLVLVRTGSVAGTGIVSANGASAGNAALNDGSGGGGAGGSILITANNTASLSNLRLAANGGTGGTNTGGGAGAHGPGGGGGGGIVLTNAAPGSASVLGGGSGTTDGGVAFGAAAGQPGIANGQISNSIANSTAGINCTIDVTAALTAPTSAASGQTVSLAAVFANNGGVAAAAVARTVTLSSGSAPNPFTSVSAPGGTISGLNTDVVTITYPAVAPLAAGASSVFNLAYTAPGTAGITATAAIAITTATSPEAITSNNTSTAVTAITGFADVVSAVFGLNSSITGEATASYAVVFANNGPAAATVTARTVQLPAGATLTTAQESAITAQGGSYAAGVISFGAITLSSRQGQSYNFSYTAPTSGGTNSLVSTIATTSAQDAGNGPGAAPDVFTFGVTNNPASDLATSGVTVSSPAVEPGQPASFVVKYINYGPAVATGALRFAQLTPGLAGVVVTDYNGTVLSGAYNAATGIVTLPALATVASGGTAYVTIAFVAPAIGPVSVSGSMSGGPGSISSGIYGNNQATGSIDVTPVADVTMVISGPTSATVGNLVTFTLSTRNNGPSPAAGVVQTVQLPTGLTGVFATNGGTYDAGTGVVTFPTLAVLGSGALTNDKVSFALAGTFTASAAVTTTTKEASGTLANNSVAAAPTTATAATTDQANVYTTLTISEKNVVPNAPVTLTLEAGNAGPAPALNVVQQLALRPGLTIPPANITNGGTYNAATGVVTFPALPSLASGATVANTVVLAAPATGPISPTASVLATTSDPVPGDNRAVRYVDVFATADVATTLVGPSIAAATQQATTFIVNMLNNGPVPARAVVQTVAIPAGLALADVPASNGGTYNPATGLITWPEVATLAVGEGRTYTYSYVAPAYASTDAASPRTLVSLATATSATSDEVPANNTAAVATLIRWNADVAIAVAGPTTAVVGNTITFAVATTNNGPAPAPSVTPTVRITTGLTNVVASGGGAYDAATGIVTFPTITNLAVGATGAVTNTISLTVPDRPLIGVSAAANVPAATNDTNLTNNAVTLTLPVLTPTTTQVDLQTTIAANVSAQQAGQPIVLTVTATNSSANGNTTTSGLRQRVDLPAGLRGVAVADASSGTPVPVPGAYDAASGVVTLPAAPSVAAGTTLTYTITVSNYSSDPLVATATLNGNFSDPLPANNTQAVSVTIVPVADVATRVSGPATRLPGGLATYEVVTLNNGPSPAGAVAQTVQLPTGLSDVAVSGGGSYDATDGRVTFPTIATQAVGLAGQVTNTIAFTFPTTASSLTATVATGTTELAGTLADNTSTLAIVLANQVPLANTYANRLQSPAGNTATALTLSALSGYDADGAVGSFTITALPVAAAGVLLLHGTPVAAGQAIDLADAAALTFDPLASFVGTAAFAYTATDNLGAVSAPATYTLAVGQDNAAVYTSTPLKSGPNQYQDGDVIANVFDANGGTYNATAAITDNGVRTASVSSGSLAAGLELDPSTGQVRVLDRSLLLTGTYPLSITTVDANGGVTTQTVALRIGDYPLPVQLTRFDALAVGQDARLTWATAQESGNKGFWVERSFDGTSFVQLGFVAGAGTAAQPRQYAYVEVGVGRQHPGPVYYRLQQVDLAGKATYGPVRAVVFAPAAPTLFPNPASTHTTLDLSGLPAAPFDVTLVDMAGRVAQAHALAGGQAHELDVRSLPGGAYVVIIRRGSLRLVCHLLKQQQ